ncbi:hypothetical protein GCM10010499_31310 [Streptomyces thermoviolaceus subsp. apingens]|nr:hypothetical protein GCM10010499_31310 [Streptomyces thermoviolaceus subsp. apingens]
MTIAMITGSFAPNSRLPSLSIPCDLISRVACGPLVRDRLVDCRPDLPDPDARPRLSASHGTIDPGTPDPSDDSVGTEAMVMFLFLVGALAVVVAAVTLAVVGGGEGDGPLPEAAPERLHDPLPPDRPVSRADVENLRFPLAVRGYCMADVDDALSRLGAELAEREARIADLESALAGARAAASRTRPEQPGTEEQP